VGRSGGMERLLQDSRAFPSDIGPGKEFPGSGVNGGAGAEGTGGGEGGASWAQGAADPVASASASPVAPLRTGKRRRDTLTQIDRQRRSTRRKGDKTTPHLALHIHTAHNMNTGDTQPLQYTDCTTGQAQCTVMGMEIRQSNPI
jgi:hypothetical protein